MAKNRKFKLKYVITVEGVTTNEYASRTYDETIKAIVHALNTKNKQVKVTIEEEYGQGSIERSNGDREGTPQG